MVGCSVLFVYMFLFCGEVSIFWFCGEVSIFLVYMFLFCVYMFLFCGVNIFSDGNNFLCDVQTSNILLEKQHIKKGKLLLQIL